MHEVPLPHWHKRPYPSLNVFLSLGDRLVPHCNERRMSAARIGQGRPNQRDGWPYDDVYRLWPVRFVSLQEHRFSPLLWAVPEAETRRIAVVFWRANQGIGAALSSGGRGTVPTLISCAPINLVHTLSYTSSNILLDPPPPPVGHSRLA